MKKILTITIILLSLSIFFLWVDNLNNYQYQEIFEKEQIEYTVIEIDKIARVTCYVDEGLTASGEYTRDGIVAVSDRSIPMNSQLYLEGFGIMDVRDKTAKWIHEKYPVMTIDVWMTAEECKEFGLKYLTYKLL